GIEAEAKRGKSDFGTRVDRPTLLSYAPDRRGGCENPFMVVEKDPCQAPICRYRRGVATVADGSCRRCSHFWPSYLDITRSRLSPCGRSCVYPAPHSFPGPQTVSAGLRLKGDSWNLGVKEHARISPSHPAVLKSQWACRVVSVRSTPIVTFSLALFHDVIET